MYVRLSICLVAWVCLCGSVPVQGAQLVTNGNFEGGTINAGVSGPLDGVVNPPGFPDTLPVGWTRVETFWGGVAENSMIAAVPGNGPSAPGSTAMEFNRNTGFASGDWSAIQQGLSIDAASWQTLTLSLDAYVVTHALEAGGWAVPAFEWPVVVQIDYLDQGNNPQTWRHGWYINPPGDSNIGPVNDPGQGLIPFYNDTLVQPTTWTPASFNLFNELPQVKTITNIRVGSSGWDYHGLADNVSIVGTPIDQEIPEPCTLVLGAVALGLIGWRSRRRTA